MKWPVGVELHCLLYFLLISLWIKNGGEKHAHFHLLPLSRNLCDSEKGEFTCVEMKRIDFGNKIMISVYFM